MEIINLKTRYLKSGSIGCMIKSGKVNQVDKFTQGDQICPI